MKIVVEIYDGIPVSANGFLNNKQANDEFILLLKKVLPGKMTEEVVDFYLSQGYFKNERYGIYLM
jgi:hypothetical protein